jgi:hypothetical protein
MMLKKYYFQDLCEHLRNELVREALDKTAHDQHHLEGSQEQLEDIDDFINRHNSAKTIIEWFKTIEAYKA